mmetsp:Transcript_63923/g.73322  ORF Transcript_63923/g.73322 Transcript_63923/m.73322 type:complete len:431 (+) Transcript_63923:134-1426(+)
MDSETPQIRPAEDFDLVYPYSLPPAEVQFYTPKQEHIKVGEGKKGLRFLWGGGQEFDAYEKDMLQQFKDHIAKKKYELPSFYDDVLLLKTLDGCKWKLDKALKSLKDHAIWRQEYLPPQLTDITRDLLSSGVVYLGGRDHLYRPIIVINVEKVNKRVHQDKKHMPDNICRASFWIMEYIIHHMYLPGKIENWVVVIDFEHVRGFSIPTGFLKRFSTMLQDNYRGVLHKMYMVNVPRLLSGIWTLVKMVLDPVTLNKIKITKKSLPEGILTHCNASQIEQRFGGEVPNLTTFWPPHRFSTDYFAEGESEMSYVDWDKISQAKTVKLQQIASWDGKKTTEEGENEEVNLNGEARKSYIRPDMPEEDFDELDMEEENNAWKNCERTAVNNFVHHLLQEKGSSRPSFLLRNPVIDRLLEEKTIHRENEEVKVSN